MTTRRIAALINPSARHGLGAGAAETALTALATHGLDVTEMIGRDAAHAQQLAHTAARSDHDAIVVIGGDGSVRMALEAARGTGMPIGLMPAGTGNDHARALGIPVDDPLAAAAIVGAAHERSIDLAQITLADGSTSVFGTVAATGLDALVTERANMMARPKGQLRYPIAAVAEIVKLKPFHYRITVDGVTIERDLVLASVGNTPSYGGGMQITPAAIVDDGSLDLTLVLSGSRLRLLTLFPTVYSGKHIHRPEVEQLRGRKIVLECEPSAPVYADGERVGMLPATIEILPGAVTFLVPRLENTDRG
ncbi:diacylglycerol kinase [Williamsia limnetica]|uniref:Diacylglycerol kinase n=1 Tax=Williamsia limnetica TaxID=882452 RepID=A0A318RPZ4_WILLI|nr:diacylglycerol kinase [Williamsia limnetica]PYE18710.1 diacylglycerol kinase [Williamsia limnetica]